MLIPVPVDARRDPLAALAELPGVGDACRRARDEVDSMLWDRQVRARAAEIAGESLLQGARATAALEGAEVSLAAMRAGIAEEDSPLGRAVAAATAVTAAIPGQLDVFGRAPLQVIAHLHVLATRGFAAEDERGRPRADDEVVDPLHIGVLPPVADIAPRLDALASVLTRPTEAPAVLVAAIAHGEVLALRPFTWGSGLVARAMLRCVLGARGVDPDLMGCPELGLLALGRPAYVKALRGYISGEPAGVAEWIILNARAIAVSEQKA
jgi:Fic family protein